MSGEIKLRIDQIKRDLNEAKIAKLAYATFYNHTPLKTGNARRNTKQDRGEIRAEYAYAQKLDQGASRQSPRGMTEPTIKFIQNYIKQKIGKR